VAPDSRTRRIHVSQVQPLIMCGINGIYCHAGKAKVDRLQLLATRDHMRARGPDGAGEWLATDGSIGFGHRRLAIIDLSDGGAQPMSSVDGRYVIVFNGEIYNYRELRDEIGRQGGTFRSQSDTEVLLKLFERDGPGMVSRLRGMFAFAIWDALGKRLFLARDPHGIKPLYYSNTNGTLRFASQVRALLAGQGVDKRVSLPALTGFFLWGSVPEPLTLYEDLCILPAGHTLMIDGRGRLEISPYWRIGEAQRRSIEAARSIGPDEATERFRTALRDSVRAHLVADVPVGAFLSAGLDSSAVVGLARECGVSVETFTVTVDDFRGRALDEAPLAAETARHLGLPHSVVTISLADARAGIPAFLAAMDQPTMDGINTWFVTEATRSAGLKVALSGLGGDELLGGYDTFATVPEIRHQRSWAQHARCMGAGYRRVYSVLARALPRLPARGSEWLAAASSWRTAYQSQRGLFMPWELSSLMRPDAARAGLEQLSKHELWEPAMEGISDFARVSILESSRYMRNQLLRDTDWVGMAHSLELRTPLVDHLLSEAAAGLAASGALGPGKTVLGRCVSNGLPQAVLQRPKTGFTLPIWQWLRTVEELASWKRLKWLRREGTRDYARWAYAVAAHLPEVRELLC